MHSLPNPPATPRPTNFKGAVHRADGTFVGYIDWGDCPIPCADAILDIAFTGPLRDDGFNHEQSQQYWLEDGEWFAMHHGMGPFEMTPDGCQGTEMPSQDWLDWLAPILLGEFGSQDLHLGSIRTKVGYIAMWHDERTGKLHLDNTMD